MGFKRVNWVWNQRGIGTSAKIVLLCLNDYYNDESGICYPSITLISEETELSRQAVQKALNILKEKGLIAVISGSSGTSNRYSINWEEQDRMKKGDAKRITKKRVCKQVDYATELTMQLDCTPMQLDCTGVCNSIDPNPYVNPSVTLNKPLSPSKNLKVKKTGLIPLSAHSEFVQKVTTLFITNVLAIYPKAKLNPEDQAHYVQQLIDKYQYTNKQVELVIRYLNWTHKESLNNERQFDWQMQIRSTAKLLKIKVGDVVTYAEHILPLAEALNERLRPR